MAVDRQYWQPGDLVANPLLPASAVLMANSPPPGLADWFAGQFDISGISLLVWWPSDTAGISGVDGQSTAARIS